MALDFYYGSGSPYAWKVWLVLEHKSIPYELKLLSFDKDETQTPAFLAINPRGKVPTIVDNGFALWESSVVAEYLEERYPQKPLLPTDAKARAIVRRIATEAQDYLYKAVGGLTEITLFKKEVPAKDELDKAKQAVMEELARIEAQFTGPGVAGALSLADFTIFPSVRMLRRIEDRKPGFGIPNDRLPPKLRGWVSMIESLPYYAKTTPPHWKG
jgi:glutathione S-transferase